MKVDKVFPQKFFYVKVFFYLCKDLMLVEF